MANKAKRIQKYAQKRSEKEFFGVLCALCKQPLHVRIGWAFDIIFKRWKYGQSN